MGLLTVGKPLNPEEVEAISAYIREHGVIQFLNTWKRVKDIADDELRFGDEIECGVFVVDHAAKTVKLSVRSAELLQILDEKEVDVCHQSEGCTWHPEFGAWMVESTPSRPYGNYASDLLRVERNMSLRRRRLLASLKENEIAPTVPCFPLLGVGDFIDNPRPFAAPYSNSAFIPDYVVNPHPRFAALATNIRTRRGSKVDIRVPLFHDTNTPEFLCDHSSEPFFPDGYRQEPDEFIHMDAMAFGMGMCCLQVTLQARDVDESRYMYDQLAVLAPIMLAMTAATPIFKGRLANVDVRWDIIAASVDDRTPAERGEALDEATLASLTRSGMAGNGVTPIPKSRYGSVSTYIYHCPEDCDSVRSFEAFNDIYCPVDERVKDKLLAAGLDNNLSHHIAHLFIRDPLVVFEGIIELDDEKFVEHFENIQSTNWQTCRWKPPPPRTKPEDPHIGWRTEFRSMEVQLTDFENAAFTVFSVLVTRVVLAFDLALYIPISRVDENMNRAAQIDAVRTQKFFFRSNIESLPSPIPVFVGTDGYSPDCCGGNLPEVGSLACAVATAAGFSCREATTEVPTVEATSSEAPYEEMTMNEIFNGKGCYFPGLIPLVYAYLTYIHADPETFSKIDCYLQFISKRARGETITAATYFRNFVQAHPGYRHDSVISPEIAHDLLVRCSDIGNGHIQCPEILGDVLIERVVPEGAYGQRLAGRLTPAERSSLLGSLMRRGDTSVPRPSGVPRGTGKRTLSFSATPSTSSHNPNVLSDTINEATS